MNETTNQLIVAPPIVTAADLATWSECTLTLPDNLSFEDWAAIGDSIARMERGVQWWIGDWWRYGEHRYGERAAQALSSSRWSFQTFMQAGWVAGAIETSRRREVLSFSHHVEVASLPPEQQDEWLAKAETENLTCNELRTAIHRAKDHQARDIEFGGDDAKSERWEILAGDFKERMLDIPAGTVDLILTDPPYPEEFADLWTDLAIEAARALRPGGILAAMSGKIHLDDRMRRLGEYLSYGWIYVQPLPGSNTRILGRHIYQEWKPWVCYSNGPWPSGRIDWHGDLLTAGPRAKEDYEWQQQLEPAIQLVERLTLPDDLVVDPFLGSGTSGVATLQAGRRFKGIEADANRVAKATARLKAVQG